MKRHSFVWTIYLLLGLFSFVLSMIGPMVPLLRDEFHFDYTMAGLHQSAFAIGMVIMGLFGDRVLRRLGLPVSLWGGLAVMVLGLLGVVLAPGPAVTLPALLVASLAGTLAVAALQTAMTSGFGAFRSKGILEANMTASVFSMLVPLVLIVGTAWGWGWRIVFPFALLMLAATAVFGLPATKKHAATLVVPPPGEAGRLGWNYWKMWLVLFFGVSVEWALGFWCMTYLLGLPGNSLEWATAGTVLLGLAGVVGRWVTSRVSHRFREETLLAAAIGLVAAGFLPYWFLTNIPLAFLGLFLGGFGAATFFPLAFSLTIAKAPGHETRAASLAPVGSGLAIGLAPFLLGGFADLFDLRTALWYIPVGLAIMSVFLVLSWRSAPHAVNNGGDHTADQSQHHQ